MMEGFRIIHKQSLKIYTQTKSKMVALHPMQVGEKSFQDTEHVP